MQLILLLFLESGVGTDKPDNTEDGPAMVCPMEGEFVEFIYNYQER